MKEVKIEIADKEYKVLIAETEEERAQGQAICQGTVCQYQADCGRTCQRAQNGHDRQEYQPWIE